MSSRASVVLPLVLAFLPMAVARAAPATVVERGVVADAGYTERWVEVPGDAVTRYRVRVWAPTGDAAARPSRVPVLVVVDGQADAGRAAALARAAEVANPSAARWIVTVAPGDESVRDAMLSPRRWSEAEQVAFARTVVGRIAPDARRLPGAGEVRLLGLGRGAAVVLRVLGDDVDAFDRLFAQSPDLDPDLLAAVGERVAPAPSRPLAPTLTLGWMQPPSASNTAVSRFLDALDARNRPYRWLLNQTEQAFVEAALWQ